MQPVILDLFCGAGGAGRGYADAGFDVIGVDINPQPDYPFEFIRADVLSADLPWDRVAAVHASPPCQIHSITGHGKAVQRGHVDLIPQTRQLLESSGLPYIIENVPGAPLIDPVMLCGSMFGLGTTVPGFGSRWFELKRHRLFETNWPTGPMPIDQCGRETAISVFGKGGKVNVFGMDWHAGKEACKRAMGTPWITSQNGVSQAIPPVFTLFLSAGLLVTLARM